MADNTKQPAPTIESLQAQLDTERTAHEQTKAALATALENHAEAGVALTEASQIIDGQKETIADLEKRNLELQSSPSAHPIITVNKVKYEVQAGSFKWAGQTYTAADLIKNKELQKELVEKGVGFLVKKED